MQAKEPIFFSEQENASSPIGIQSSSRLVISKKIIYWLLVVLVILLFGATGVFAYKYFSLKQQVSNQSLRLLLRPTEITNPTVSSILPPSPTTNPVANWKTYSTNAYIFKYPQNISLAEGRGNIVKLSLWGPTQKENTEFDGISLSFSLPFQLENISLSDYVDQEIEQSKKNADILKQKTNINVNGVDGYTYTVRGLGTYKYIYLHTYLQSLDRAWTVYIIDGTNDPTGQGYARTVNQILSTFRFID